MMRDTQNCRIPLRPELSHRCLVLAFFLASLPAASICAQVLVQIGQNFTGSTLGINSDALPPDPNGAAGPNHYVEWINGRFSVYNKTNASRVTTMNDLTFWSRAGISVPGTWSVTDPRLIYDPSVQRWFASMVDFDPSLRIIYSHFLLAVSAGADPTGTWRGVSFLSDTNAVNFADFPTLGLDRWLLQP
jgi:hypothetical protein